MGKKYFFLLLFILSLAQFKSVAQGLSDSIIFENYIKKFKDSRLPINEMMAETALYFTGRPYVASTLEHTGQEKLTVDLREFDCATFVESCIALSLTAKSANPTFAEFKEYLQSIRYRGGSIDGYASRLHYMTDWLYDNSKRGIVSDLSREWGAKPTDKVINFMSSHLNLYPKLVECKELQADMVEVERAINGRNSYYVTPKNKIPELEPKIKNGDIVIFATSILGLDYTHIGIVYRAGNRLSFIHASTRTMKVITESQSLYNYCMKSSKCTGITLIRVNNNELEK